MNRPLPLTTLFAFSVCLLASTPHNLSAQAGPPPQQPCVILKRMGPADEVTSHLYSFGIRGKQFQYQDGQLPKGIKFHGRLTDKDVRTIQDAGGRVEFIDVHFTDQELEHARTSCGISTPNTSAPPPVLTYVMVKSTPDGADITIDGKYVGSTPSKLKLEPGSHTILIEQAGYAPWQRTVTVTSGEDITVNSTLERKPPANPQ